MKAKTIFILEAVVIALLSILVILSIIKTIKGSLLFVILGTLSSFAMCLLGDDATKLYRYLKLTKRI